MPILLRSRQEYCCAAGLYRTQEKVKNKKERTWKNKVGPSSEVIENKKLSEHTKCGRKLLTCQVSSSPQRLVSAGSAASCLAAWGISGTPLVGGPLYGTKTKTNMKNIKKSTNTLSLRYLDFVLR